jgi:hypothetical protein
LERRVAIDQRCEAESEAEIEKERAAAAEEQGEPEELAKVLKKE